MELRVFISSTFRDLQPEREHLVKKIFPEIRSICRAQGVTFTEIDLRWGLTEETQVLGQVIGACLEEIDKCRPYFIGITGSRYGYVPEFHEIQKDPGLMTRYPWLEDAVMDGASILDMEFRHAVLNQNPEALQGDNLRARFYFREDDATGAEDVSEEEKELLFDLKDRVLLAGLPVEEFGDPVTLGELIYDELLDILQNDFAGAKPPTPLMEERARHDSFASSRRHAYIANTTYLKRLNQFADDKPATTRAESAGENNQLIIHATSGSGKSALLAFWVAQYRRRHPDAFVIEHYVGIGAGQTDRLEIIRHVMMEIDERYNLGRVLPNTQESIEQEFPSWLAEVQKEPLILVVDAVNQLGGQAQHLGWLPKYIPPNVRLIVSTTNQQTLSELVERGWESMEVRALNQAEREAVIVRFLGEYRKALPVDLIRRIATDPKCALPLFLRTLLEELRVFGEHERLEQEVERYVATNGPEDLFQLVLERFEQDSSVETVRTVLSLLWASQAGLSDYELAAITGIPRNELSSLVIALDYHLLFSNGCLTFFHDYLRRAVQTRYLQTDEAKRDRHLELAAYFQRILDQSHSTPFSASAPPSFRSLAEAGRAAHELPWHYQQSGDIPLLKEALSRLDVFTEYAEGNGYYEFLVFWHEAGGVAEMERCYDQQLRDREDQTGESEEKLLTRMCELYRLAGTPRSGVPLGHRAVALGESRLGADHIDVSESLDYLGHVLLQVGEYSEAEHVLRRALTVSEPAQDMNLVRITGIMNKLAIVLKESSQYDESIRLQRRVLAMRQSALGSEHPDVALSQSNLAEALRLVGNRDEAEGLNRRALVIRERSLGPNHPLVAESLNNLAFILSDKGSYAQAEPLERRALEIWEKAFGEDHYIVATGLNTLAILLWHSGQYAESEKMQRRVLEIWEASLGHDHPNVAVSLYNLASVLWQAGRYAEAEQLQRRALGIFEKALGDRHPAIAQSLDNLANVLRDTGDSDQAEPLYRRALGMAQAMLGDTHHITGRIMQNLGRLYVMLGQFDNAADHLPRALEILEQTLGADHWRTAVAVEALGELHWAQGEHEQAALFFRRTLQIRQHMFGEEHPETVKAHQNMQRLTGT